MIDAISIIHKPGSYRTMAPGFVILLVKSQLSTLYDVIAEGGE